MKKSKIKKILLYFLITLLVTGSVLAVIFYGESAISIITTMTTLLGIYAIFIEVKRGKALKHAQFLIYLNDFFTKDESNLRIAHKLHDFIDHDKQTFVKEDQSDIIDFLVYWESVAPSLLRGLLSLEKVDDMLSYRFFEIMNNPYVQQIEIIPEAEYYRGCIKLHKMWTQFKLHNNLPLLLAEHSLEKNFPNYEKYAN